MLLLCLFVMSFWNDMMILIIVRGACIGIILFTKIQRVLCFINCKKTK